MPCSGPNCDAARAEGEKFARALIDEWNYIERKIKERYPEHNTNISDPYGWATLASRIYRVLIGTIDCRRVSEGCAHFWLARPEASLETFRAYIVDMFVLHACLDF